MATLARPRPERTTGGRELVGLISVSHALQHLYVALLPLTDPLVVAEFHVSYTALGAVLGVAGAGLPALGSCRQNRASQCPSLASRRSYAVE